MADVRFDKVAKHFGKVEVIGGVDLEVPDGSFTVFVGPSGCGKSTLLRLVAGLENVSSGSIFIGGEDVTDLRPIDRGVAMVFQSYALYPHLSVFENIAFGLRLAKTPNDEVKARVGAAAETLQLTELLDRKPRALSGGQRQRVAIGRAIVREPQVFLFDEPLSNLDAALRTQMRVEIAELRTRLGTTTIYVTHDQVEAMTLADQIVVLNKGSIEQVGSPLELYEKPANTFVAGFIGSPKMNLIGGPSAARRNAALVGVRPEHIRLTEEGGGEWSGDVMVAEHLGSDTFLHVRVEGNEPIVVRVTGEVKRDKGSRVFLAPEPDRLHLFDAEGQALN
jgi:multiple sugar transport system ATP-binding protein